jgi:hypothetical protein
MDEAAEANARKAVVGGGSEHRMEGVPDPGMGYRIAETPGGEAKVVREEEDGLLLVWMFPYRLNVRVPADLVR